MNTICGANCDGCSFRNGCKGCAATCGRPFGGACVAAEYIKANGKEKYAEFKKETLDEINAALKESGISRADELWELRGAFVNLSYPLSSGENVKFLDDNKIYLGAQIKASDEERCFGVVADTDFILICSYGENGSDPELIAYKKR